MNSRLQVFTGIERAPAMAGVFEHYEFRRQVGLLIQGHDAFALIGQDHLVFRTLKHEQWRIIGGHVLCRTGLNSNFGMTLPFSLPPSRAKLPDFSV